ncbi:MAG: hypothetical protein QNJ90_05590 [Planctomycetota bacterium]|nr:hypothetical protein [Planctomycetota bacterium]
MNNPSLTPEQCWADGGRLALEITDGGARVRIGGNHEGLVGLARVLLWLAQYRAGADETLDLSTFAEFDAGPTLELHAPR